MAMSIEERVARLEAINEQILARLDSIDRRLNTNMTINIGLWITTIVAIVVVGVFK